MNKFLVLMSMSIFSTGIYAMQPEDFNPRFPSPTKEEKKQEIVELSYGYVPLQKHDALFKTGFFRLIAAIDSFWYDKDSCGNVKKEVNALYNLSKVQLKEVYDETYDNLFRNNNHIVKGAAQAAVDQAKHVYAKKCASELKRVNALPIECIMKQARINLLFVKKTIPYCADVVKQS